MKNCLTVSHESETNIFGIGKIGQRLENMDIIIRGQREFLFKQHE